MTGYDNRNSGVLFPNDKKHGKQPDFTGKLDVDGRELSLSAWSRTSKAGREFLSLRVSEPGDYQKRSSPPREREAPVEKPSGRQPPATEDFLDDDIPF